MKTLRKAAFPVLLILTCGTVHFWQHAVASLPYLPKNCVVPLGVSTPALLVLTFWTTFAMLKETKTPKYVRKSFLSAGAMLVPILATGVYFLSFLTYRYAAVLPVPVLPDWPTGIVTMIITAVCLLHLTGLLIARLVKGKTKAKRAIPAIVGWLLLNACLFLITT